MQLASADWDGLEDQGPVAADLSADQCHRITTLRQSFVGLPTLLDLLMPLRLRLHSTLSQRKPSRPLLLRLNNEDLCLNPPSREVWRGEAIPEH